MVNGAGEGTGAEVRVLNLGLEVSCKVGVKFDDGKGAVVEGLGGGRSGVAEFEGVLEFGDGLVDGDEGLVARLPGVC